jgi:hypothetical protein
MTRCSRYNPPLLVAVVGTVLVSPAASRPLCADPPHFRLEQLAREMPAQFRDWWFGRFYPDNIQTLFKEADAVR